MKSVMRSPASAWASPGRRGRNPFPKDSISNAPSGPWPRDYIKPLRAPAGHGLFPIKRVPCKYASTPPPGIRLPKRHEALTGLTALRQCGSGALVIAPKMKVDPGRRLIQFPHTRWHAAAHHFLDILCRRQTSIGTIPNTQPIRVNFAPTVPASATGTVADMLGTT